MRAILRSLALPVLRRPLCSLCFVYALITALVAWFRPLNPGLDVDGAQAYVEGEVLSKQMMRSDSGPVTQLVIRPRKIQYGTDDGACPRGGILCKLDDTEEQPSIGETVVVSGKLYGFERAANPGQFDALSYYTSESVAGRLVGARVLGLGGRISLWSRIKEALWKLRSILAGRITQALPEPEAGVLCAMLLGDKAALDPELKALYQDTGIAHILAISGLHISIIGLGLWKLLRHIHVPRLVASLISSLAVAAYAMMAGMPLSAARALIMFVLRLASTAVGRTYDMATALSVSAVALLLGHPERACSLSFLMSFTAIAGICAFSPVLAPDEPFSGHEQAGFVYSLVLKCRRSLADASRISLSILLAMLPLQLSVFYKVPVYAVLLNLIVLPLMTPVVISGGLAMLLPLQAAGVAGLPARLIIKGYSLIAHACLSLPASTWIPGTPPLWAVLVFNIIAVIAIAARKYVPMKYRVGFLCGAVLSLCVHLGRGENLLRVTFLDVGQGNCACVQLPGGGTWLVDGGSTSVSEVGKYRIEPFLLHEGITQLDAVFLSHSDADHINGVTELVNSDWINIKMICPPSVSITEFADLIDTIPVNGNIAIQYIDDRLTLSVNDVRVNCLHPVHGHAYDDSNASSECIYLTYGQFGLLFTGDVQGEGEEELTQALSALGVDNVTVLMVAHHGSRGSSSEEFLEQIDARYAVISCGRNNRYGHPHAETLTRLRDDGSVIYETNGTGCIRMCTDGNRLWIRH